MSPRVAVVGAGAFGLHAAAVLARAGARVTVFELDDAPMRRASSVNQARLHTGLHYPRSLLTARASLAQYARFRDEFPAAVRDFRAVYAVARHGSKTGPAAFASFADRLGVATRPVRVAELFDPSRVATALEVEEASFDAPALRAALLGRLPRSVELRLSEGIASGAPRGDGVALRTTRGARLDVDRVVLATYAGTNGLRAAFGLAPLPLQHELTHVVLGRVGPGLANVGLTVMDGDFWSLMPFGHTGLHSLTSVGWTPHDRAGALPGFPCQPATLGGPRPCAPGLPARCGACAHAPAAHRGPMWAQARSMLAPGASFEPVETLVTIKTVLRTTEVDDSRPTFIESDPGGAVVTVFSGKISTLFDLETRLLPALELP